MPFLGLLLLISMLLPLVFLQRFLHREIHAILLILTRSQYVSIRVFSTIFLPGVFLHELSHFVAAKLLRVRTGRFSLIPAALPDGRLQMGYVETAQSDIFRDSLIGVAPLLAGSLFIAYAGVNRLRVDVLWDLLLGNNLPLFFKGMSLFPAMPDFYFWAYLIFSVSTTMMPSEADRHAWLPLGLWTGMVLALAVFAGAGSWMLNHLAPLLDSLLTSAAMLFALSVALHVVLFVPLFIFRLILSRMTGLRVK